MLTRADENKLVNDLREVLMIELRGEDIGVQIRVAFAVLTQVIMEGAHRDPSRVQRSLHELQAVVKPVNGHVEQQ